jgi:hypothetical protein
MKSNPKLTVTDWSGAREAPPLSGALFQRNVPGKESKSVSRILYPDFRLQTNFKS